ncbi:MAG TPA: hypothetical protein ENN14_00950 [Chloroflexi bacterium]|nr:hypothetical protein [Chloroflexota bacterium]
MSLSRNLPRRKGREPINLLARRHNYFPKRFLWRGQEYHVHAVERAWTEQRRGQAARHFFRVRCSEGIFDLYQDLRLNAWYLAREVH